jgi:AcrR family transcriptional regulator
MAPAPVPARIGQGTAVEQSRAVAEVQAAVVVAQQVPRSIGVARTAMQESCQQAGLAERAFYRYPRGGQTISGDSVHLARELARCWGNVQYGINELRRDDEFGQSEMQAWAWDVQTNARSSQTFIVPHKRDKRGGAERLVDLRDIYENNANMGARRLREAIFSILPPWFTEEARELCTQTLERGDGRPLDERIDSAVKVFDALGISAERLEQKLGRPYDRWTGYDIAQLRITHKSIQRGEVTVDDEFPPPRVTVDEITQGASDDPGRPSE